MPDKAIFEVLNPAWQKSFDAQHFSNFKQIWEIDSEPFEPINERRGGTSGVYRIPFISEQQQNIHVFLKKQENHYTKSWRHPIKGVPTFYREFLMLQALSAKDIPVVQWLAFGWQDKRAFLITNELAGYDSFEDFKFKNLNQADQKTLLASMAQTLAKLHQYSIRHGSCYPKHLFIKYQDNAFICKLIDLEKAHPVLFQKKAIVLDLAQLIKHDRQLNPADIDYLLEQYCLQLKQKIKPQDLLKQIQKRIYRK